MSEGTAKIELLLKKLPGKTWDVDATIKDEDTGQRIQNAKVTIVGFGDDQTNSIGIAQFLEVPEATYQITAEKVGYTTVTDVLNLPPTP